MLDAIHMHGMWLWMSQAIVSDNKLSMLGHMKYHLHTYKIHKIAQCHVLSNNSNIQIMSDIYTCLFDIFYNGIINKHNLEQLKN